MTEGPPLRLLGPLLLVGLLTFPIVFGWVLLRRGYTPSLRWTVLTYTIVSTVIPAVGRALG